jgi:hypothetical protein
MVDLYISLDEDQYNRLQQRARHDGISVEHLVIEMLAEADEWRRELEEDPVAELLGQIDDPIDPNAIDDILYVQPQ